MSEDIEPQPKDIRGRTWLDAFYVQTKAFLEKNSEHVKEIERLKAAAHDDDTCPHLVRANLLEAENARLKAEVNGLKEERRFLNGRLDHFVQQTVKNREQVKRLTKAGDAMVDWFFDSDSLVKDWNAAKEGKCQP